MSKPASTSLLAEREGAAALPSVDKILSLRFVEELVARHGRQSIHEAIRQLLAEKRQAIVAGSSATAVWPAGEQWIAADLQGRLQAATRSRLRPVFNLTGTVLHTNLGRALMPEEAVQAVVMAMQSPVNLEYDLTSGGRGERDQIVEDLLRSLTGAEAATVVNNNAAAVLLALNALANRKEVIVSRGELIEIGGSFRIPDIMTRAGARLVEVGTTNRTHVGDYEEAIGPNSALIAKVHTSNYAIHGFAAQVSQAELATLAHAHKLPLLIDLGSGSLVDLTAYGLPKEPTARAAIEAGADLVSFSGDKLLGGPQAGIVVGRAELIARLRKNPLKRALRVDKMTVAALEAVLQLYRNPEKLASRLTTLRLLTRSQSEIEMLARNLLPVLQQVLADRAKAELRTCHSQIGSGSLPVDLLPSAALVITTPTKGRGSGSALKSLKRAFRALPTPVLGRVSEGALWLDLRCLEDAEPFLAQLSELKLPGS